MIPSGLLFGDARLDVFHFDCVHDGPEGHALGVLEGGVLAKFGRVRQGEVLDELGDALDDGDEVGHRHLLLDDVARHDQHHSRDEFFLMIGHDGLGGCGKILFGLLD